MMRISGVNIYHEDLVGRASWGDTISDDDDLDHTGHGSHMAVGPLHFFSKRSKTHSLVMARQGTIAGTKYDVAKHANVVAVKILANGGGRMKDVIGGLVWATGKSSEKKEAAKKARETLERGRGGSDEREAAKHKGSVLSMSVWGGQALLFK